jgi:hypothetical protein
MPAATPDELFAPLEDELLRLDFVLTEEDKAGLRNVVDGMLTRAVADAAEVRRGETRVERKDVDAA